MTSQETNTDKTSSPSGDPPVEGTKDASPAAPPRRWRRRLAITAIVLFVFYTLFGFFGVPLLIRTTGISRLNDRLNGAASLQRATFNPFTWRLVLEGFEIDDASGARQIAFDRFDGNMQPWATLFRKGYRFKHAILDQPFALIERGAGGSLNLASLFRPSAEAGEPWRVIPRIAVYELAVHGAELVARDEAVGDPVERTISNLEFTVPQLDTLDDHENTHRLTAQLDEGGSIDWTGSFFADPLTATGTLTVDGVQLKPFMPYARAFTNARITDGRLSFELSYDFAPLREPRRAEVKINRADLEELLIALEENTIVTLPRLEISEAFFDADAQHVNVARIGLSDPHLVAHRNSDGTMRLAALLAENPTGGVATDEGIEAPDAAVSREASSSEFELEQLHAAIIQLLRDLTGPWTLALTEFEISGADVMFDDAAVEPAVEIHLVGTTLRAGPLTLDDGHPIPFSVSAKLDDGGFTCEGESSLTADRITCTIDSQDLDLTLFAGYLLLARVVPEARLDSGRLDLAGNGRLDRLDDRITTTFKGTADISSLQLTSSKTGGDVVVLDHLNVTIDSDAAVGAVGLQALNYAGAIELETAALQWPLAGTMFADADRLNARIDLAIDRTDPEQVAIRINGNSTIGGAHVRMPDRNKIDAAIDEITLDGISFDQLEHSLKFESITVAAPVLQLEAAMLPPDEPAESAPSDEDEESRTPPSLAQRLEAYRQDGSLGYLVRLGRLTVSSGSIELVDRAADPPVAITMEEIEVDASNLANDGATLTQLDITSRVQGTGQTKILGAIDPFRPVSPFVDVAVDVTGLPLKPYDPYAGHFLGYLIESGRATLNVPLHVDEGALDGSIKADLSRLHLGAKTESSAAPTAPIKLGLDLIRDPDDHIRAKIDFDGDVNDPTFRLGRVIWEEFLGMLVQGATAPLRLLASVFGGNEELDLSVLTFEPGTDQFTAEATDKLDVLGRALTERPALHLAIAGRAVEEDLQSLRRRLLDEQLLARLRQADEQLRSLTPTHRAEAIEALFAQTYPERVVTRVPVPPGLLQQGATLTEMETALLENVVVDQETIQSLVAARTQRVIDVLVSEHAIASDRVTAVEELSAPPEEHTGPRAELELY